ncbi:hypothetical protein PCYB_115330 [Plasmodium cynomolgi strain B]|uniref:RNA-binding protein n=1 Tax=Plasmodium cynomolgi (strain B) TaxID=1120755 RepID=K6UL91_PLACD|nr:hypothetical protein PCYB_115330 [Plasmodium cynomolgi strain B]GAB67513.1 hypothetical protein PCYB_115330 [Plasmodium cynomolgi strain B]
MEGDRRYHMQGNCDMSMNSNCEPNANYYEGPGGMHNGLYYNSYEDDRGGSFPMGRGGGVAAGGGNVYMGDEKGMVRGGGGLHGGRTIHSMNSPPNVVYNRNFNLNSNPNYNTGSYPTHNNEYSGMNYQMMSSSGSGSNYPGSMVNVNMNMNMNMSSPSPYPPREQYVLNKKAAKILYIHNITSKLADENFIYSVCYVYGNVESVSYMKGKNLFIVKFESSDGAFSAYKYLPTHFKNIHLELRNESRKISYFNEKANSNKYISPNISEKKFLSLSLEKREQIMNIKQKELLRKCKEKLNQYINMFNNKSITDETKEKLKCLIDHLKTRIESLNNQCDGNPLGDSSSATSFNNYDRGPSGNISGGDLSGGSLSGNNNPKRYAIIKYSNENIARNVFKNCSMCNINVEFVQDDADGQGAS